MGGPAPRIPDKDFIQLFETIGPTKLSRQIGVSTQKVHERRTRLEQRTGRRIVGPAHYNQTRNVEEHPQRVHLDVKNGVVIVGSDGHYWPGEAPVMHRALVNFAKDMQPKALIFNGDAFDGASISRHPPIGWTDIPTVQDEIETCQERLGEIEEATPKGCKLVWSLGNHDMRFETRIATVAPEYAKVNGTSLKDHFPVWKPCWSAWINDDQGGVVVKHRFKNGIHAPYNNTVHAGRSMVTGHLHSAKVAPFSDYNGTRFGVDTGCLADAFGAQFNDYSEDSPRNWRSAFAVLTFHKGVMLWPELVVAVDKKHVQFRGEIITV